MKYNGVYDELEYLKEKISKLENMSVNMKLALIQISLELGWSDTAIKNVIGAFDNELEFFRNSMEKFKL
ncbi:hypothetical protein [Asaccharospora irregularis]|uniref:Uncharacterized protein n=1 Tax=Asaccharospora irregularis DSM 2635 TaxID=1121321 RepID=A0A1M5QY90_9FIRM|nr:hypothetical protein [Asaccharospora irregularis]SHH18669.1 hypothetical protein SAMN04488530_1254 [Asaccharospora irregularis DSM 2635]